MHTDDLTFAERTIQLAADYVAGRALDGVDVDFCHVWKTMYKSLVPLSTGERVMHAPTAH